MKNRNRCNLYFVLGMMLFFQNAFSENFVNDSIALNKETKERIVIENGIAVNLLSLMNEDLQIVFHSRIKESYFFYGVNSFLNFSQKYDYSPVIPSFGLSVSIKSTFQDQWIQDQ